MKMYDVLTKMKPETLADYLTGVYLMAQVLALFAEDMEMFDSTEEFRAAVKSALKEIRSTAEAAIMKSKFVALMNVEVSEETASKVLEEGLL